MPALKISRWGNSLAIRLPVNVVRQMDLQDGQMLELETAGASSMTLRRKLSQDEAQAMLKRLTRTVAEGWLIDRSSDDYRG